MVYKKSCRPVSRILSRSSTATIIYLGWSLLATSICLPTPPPVTILVSGQDQASSPGCGIYLAFQHARFTRIPPCSGKLWALTPHFHLCRGTSTGIVIFCGTVSPPTLQRECPEVIGMRCSMLSGLSFPRCLRR